ncbi:MAG: alginate export family protein [bacterium]|nr:alginate export family protein [bacterium]
MKSKLTAILSITLLLCGTPLLAQEYSGGEADATETAPEPEIPQWLDGLRVFGMIRFRPQFESNYDFDKTNDDVNEYVGSKLWLGVEKDFGDDVMAKILLQDTRIWGGQPGSDTGLNTANNGTNEALDVREAFIHIKDLVGPVDLRAGRQIMRYGDRRLVGNTDWNDVGRSFDGFRFMFDSKYFDSHLWGTVLGESDSGTGGNVTSVGSQNSSGFTTECDPVTGVCTLNASTVQELDDGYFTGFYNTIKFGEWVHTELYYLGRHLKWKPAFNPVTFAPNATVATQDRRQDRDNLHTFGSRITNRTVSKGGRKVAVIPFDFTLEYAYQTGSTGVRVDPDWDTAQVAVPVDPTLFNATNNNCQGSFTNGSCRIYSEKQRYDAFAAVADAGYTINDFVRIGAEYNVASGDPDRADGAAATFNNLFPAAHYIWGIADRTSWQNMIGRSINLQFFFGAFGTLRMAYWEVDKHTLQDAQYAVTTAPRNNLTTESRENARFGDILDSSGNITSRAVAGLRQHLYKEYDIWYNIKYKGVDWEFGYSLIHAGDAVEEVLGDRRNVVWAREDKFDPTAHFAYLMMTYKF